MAKKKVVPRKAMPTVWNLEQLDEEMRVALGLAQRPGVSQFGGGTPYVHPRRTMQGRGKRRAEVDVSWTEAQLATIQTTMENHVATPLFGERSDIRICRLYLGEAAPTAAQTVTALKALIRIIRNEMAP